VPEGDTVFLAGRRLHDALAGRQLLSAELRHPRLIGHDLSGRTVREVVSVGKHLLTRLDDDRTLHSHFLMDGAWHLYRPGERWRGPTHHVRVVLRTRDRVAVGFRLHQLRLVPTSAEHRLVGRLGPDLLTPGWNRDLAAEAVRRLSARPETALGVALMDQRLVAGIGNLYKAEVCFLLGASPWTPVADADLPAAVGLARTLLLRNAWRPEQSTTGELARGAQHWVYGRTGRACRRCGGVILAADQHPADDEDGLVRLTYYCPTCQPGPGPGPAADDPAAGDPATRPQPT
jgi:endonuclease-8